MSRFSPDKKTEVQVRQPGIPTKAESKDMQEYLKAIQQLVRERRYQEALDRFVWFDDHALEYDQGIGGVRLSFALSYWKALGEVYQPAKQAMLDTRDRKTRQLREGKGNAALFQDVAALNHTLGDDDATVPLFREIDKADAALAAQCWYFARDLLFSQKQYDLAKKFIPSPLKDYDHVKKRYDEGVALYNDPRMGGAHFREWNEKHFVEQCLQLIELASFLNDDKAAEEIRQRATGVLDDPRLCAKDRATSESDTPAEPSKETPDATK